MLILSAIHHFVRITLFIACTPPPWLEAQLNMCVVDEDGNSQGQVIQHRSGMCMLPGEVLPRVCIARAAVNESVCEDLQVQSFYFRLDHS